MQTREKGMVKWFSQEKGFGFIQREQGTDVFVHCQAVKGEEPRSLKVGLFVTQGRKGLQAEEVLIVE